MHSHERFEQGPEWGRARRGRAEGQQHGFELTCRRPGGPPGRQARCQGHGVPQVALTGCAFRGSGPGPGGGGPWGGRGGGRGGGRSWGRARRGDIRSAILALLAERPMHGYEIIGELSERTEGLWRPSPGSIYPTLQLLEDEGLVTAQSEEGGGKRRYSLTDDGRGSRRRPSRACPLGGSGGRCARGRQDAASGRHEAHARRAPGHDDWRSPRVRGGGQNPRRTRRRLYAILASEQGGAAPSGGAESTEGPTAPSTPPQT